MVKLLNLHIKQLNAKKIVLSVLDNEKILNIKKTLHHKKNVHILPENQNLIYAGRILHDDNPLSTYNIDDRAYLLVIIKPNRHTLKSKFTKKMKNCLSKNEADFQKAQRDILTHPERIGDVIVGITSANHDLAEDLKTDLDKFLLLIGINSEELDTKMVEEFLTVEEKLMVHRMIDYGFSFKEVTDTFFKCNRNQQKTTDLLLQKLEEENSS